MENSICYCSTADCWKDNSNQTYIGITVKLLTNTFDWTTRVLGLFPLSERHTGKNLKEIIENSFKDFKVDKKKLTVLSTDGEQAIKNVAIGVDGNSII